MNLGSGEIPHQSDAAAIDQIGCRRQRFLFVADAELPLVDATQRLLLCYPMSIWAAKALAKYRRDDEAQQVARQFLLDHEEINRDAQKRHVHR